ncbi:hypothetical protein Tco_1110832 [Tanacetum coccineum]|uniref:Uncharacterized protein n=1 Tax=Tanacetum coccineum TaxID=301880 RepID=A0ABQ5IMH5_9ASTR
MSYNEKTGVYSCQVDEQWFDLSADLLRKALAITPVNPAHPFELPPSGDTVIDFVNELGYPEPVEIVSSIRTNYVYQPWRAILSLLNQADMGRVYSRDPDIFLTQSKPQSQSEEPKEENFCLVTTTGDDYVLGNLKFVPKGESVEVFRMAIPDPLITEAIQQSSYYPKYLKMELRTQRKPLRKAQLCNLQHSVLHPKSLQPPHQSNKPSQLLLLQRNLPSVSFHKKLERGKLLSNCDEEDKLRQDDDLLLDLAKRLSFGSSSEKGEEKAHSLIDSPKKKRTTDQFILARRDQTPPDLTTGPSSQPEDDTSEKVIHESSSTSDSERTEIGQDSRKLKRVREIIRAKKDQDKEKQDSTYSSGQTDKLDLEEYDLKSVVLSRFHNKKKVSANKNPTNYRLYHALNGKQ